MAPESGYWGTEMAPEGAAGLSNVTDRIVAIRDKWHTKRHPMFRALAAGELNLRVLGVYMAQHAKYVRHGLEAFGLVYAKAPGDVRKMLVENMAEEEGLIGGHTEHGAHDHMEMIYTFCAAAGMTRDEVLGVDMPAAWWGRALYYLNTARVEPVGVMLAMAFTQEGQMPALNSEVVPAGAGDPLRDRAHRPRGGVLRRARDGGRGAFLAPARPRFQISRYAGDGSPRGGGRRGDVPPALGLHDRHLPDRAARREGGAAAGRRRLIAAYETGRPS